MKSADQKVTLIDSNSNNFDHKMYTVTNFWGQLLCCFGGPYQSTIVLEPEFVVIEDLRICGNNRRRIAYGEYSVDRSSFLCCISVNDISPGCGCSKSLVDEISEELQRRVGNRGNTGQMQKAEQTLDLLLKVNSRLDEIEKKIDVMYDKMQRS